MTAAAVAAALVIPAVSSSPASGLPAQWLPLTGAADFDGDGLSDVVIGDENAAAAGRGGAGVAYLFYGRRQPRRGPLRRLKRSLVFGPAAKAHATLPSLAGDVNGDGLTDLLLIASVPGQGYVGYVVPGRRRRAAIDLASCAGCTRVIGIRQPLRPAGDVNGDGLADVVTTRGADVIVVFGSRAPSTIDLRDPAAAVLRITGPHKPIGAGGVGDLNADGRADISVEWNAPAIDYPEPGYPSIAELSVVFGAPGPGPIDATTPGTTAASIMIPSADRVTDMNAAGDLDGDGHDDLAVGNIGVGGEGCPAAPGEYTFCRGTMWVVFGPLAAATVDLNEAPTQTLALLPEAGHDEGEFGDSPQGIGDFNDDHVADLAVGTAEGRTAYVLGDWRDARSHGDADTGNYLTRLYFDDHDRELVGEPGVSVAGVGDVNGDGKADVLADSYYSRGDSQVHVWWLVFGNSRRRYTVNLRKPSRAALVVYRK